MRMCVSAVFKDEEEIEIIDNDGMVHFEENANKQMGEKEK